MSILANAKLNLSKVDKSKLFKGKDGALYLDVTISISDTKDKYDNDVSVTVAQTKEQREAKEPKNYLGNGKVFWKSTPSTNQVNKPVQSSNSDLPF